VSAGTLRRRWNRLLTGPLRRLVDRPGRWLRAHVEPGMTVLDVGCGEGHHSLALARLVDASGRVVAVDLRADALDELARRAARARLGGRIEARPCTARDLGVADLAGRVDLALAVYVLHHAADAARLVGEVHRVLRPGGAFLVVEPGHHASPAERESVEALARAAGFAVADHPRLRGNWAVRLVKGPSAAG
jgi:ubiquinone/menaquinone biosynthesis C-methylase UbiE